jgi:hypothetical protein
MRENHSVAVEPEPVSVQVVERVGLVAFSFQFFTRHCLKNQFLVCPWLNKMTLLLSNVLHLL